jgi:pilus assembly protein CpaB
MAGSIAWSALREKSRKERAEWDPQPVLCAAQDIDEGTPVDQDMVRTCQIPAQFLTESFIRLSEGADPDTLIPWGQKLIIPVKKNDPLLSSEFESHDSVALAQEVPRRMRAVAMEASERASVAELVRPNDHVDVIGTFRTVDGRETIATTILNDVIVLATGHQTGMNPTPPREDDRHYRHAVLLVMPDEAELLALAQEVGSLSLSLRNPEDTVQWKPRGEVTGVTTLITGELERAIQPIRVQLVRSPGPVVCRGNECSPSGPDTPVRKEKAVP